jgi:hypothetical protein
MRELPLTVARRLLRAWLALGTVLLATACIQVVRTTQEQEPEPRAPDPLISMTEPKLEPTGVEGLLAAPALDPTLYYYEPDELWYRYAYKRWYQAFRWDGNWFIPDDVPKAVKDRSPKETPKTVKDKAKELKGKLDEIDRQERLEQLEREMNEIDKKDGAPAKKEGAPQGDGSAPDAKTPAPDAKKKPVDPD